MSKVKDVNFFPEFVPLEKGDELWEEEPEMCHGCQKDFHFILLRPVHCTVCGLAFCKHCCHPQTVYNNHNACSGCVAQGMVLVKERYDKKRTEQLKKHHSDFHIEKDKEIKQEANTPPLPPKTEVDELYGKSFEALYSKKPKEHHEIDVKSVGVNEVNFFPDFHPLREGDEKWQTEHFKNCPECHEEYHPVLRRETHCTNCGEIFCGYCCKPQRVFNDNPVCGSCVVYAMVMIKEKYDKKRTNQLKALHAKYHGNKAGTTAATTKTKPTEGDNTEKQKSEERGEGEEREQELAEKSYNEHEEDQRKIDELYGRAYEVLVSQMGNVPASKPSRGTSPNTRGVTLHDQNFFPEFEPLRPGDETWETEADPFCPSCKSSWHPLTHRQTHCTVCGFIFCHHCAIPQKIYNNHVACSSCVANAMMLIKERYDLKRRAQLNEYHKKYSKSPIVK